MTVWFLNQFYSPDRAPTGVMLEAVVEHLSGKGHRCVVWCSGGSYLTSNIGRRTSDVEDGASGGARGVRVQRVGTLGAGKSFFGKLRGWLGFYVVLGWRLLAARERPDVIVAMTTPPFLSVLARVAAWRHGARHAHWVMDLYPDVLVAHGMLRHGGPAERILSELARWGFGGKRAGAVLTLGPCMAKRVERVVGGRWSDGGGRLGSRASHENSSTDHGTRTTVHWVPLWSGAGARRDPAGLDEAARRLRRDRGWGDDEMVVLYSGNLGRGHVVEPVLERALELAGGGGGRMRWVFCAHGARLDEVRRFAANHPEAGIEFLEPVASENLEAHLASADVHLASLAESWTGCMVPSKLQGIFAVGRPVLFVGGMDSSIGQWVRESGGGWVVRPGDLAGLRVALEEARDPAVREARGNAARDFAAGHFDQERNAARVAEILCG
jgi:colanic acid biosynthesis glycosyl transferase WcaI